MIGKASATAVSAALSPTRGRTRNVQPTIVTPTVTMPASIRLGQSRPGTCFRIISTSAAASTT